MALRSRDLLMALLAGILVALPAAQGPGVETEEVHPKITIHQCEGRGDCFPERVRLTLDSQYRWTHDKDGYDNCVKGNAWDEDLCPDPITCASQCVVDGVDLDEYPDTYGVKAAEESVEIRFGTKTKIGTNYGSRVYVLEDEKYKMFKLKNREFSFDVDMSKLPCGLNGAIYFTGMDPNGGKGQFENTAGAKYGLGYCDATCPKGIKFVNGLANTEDWDPDTQTGKYGACCPELDIWEANRNATALTVHPCKSVKQERCEGHDCDGNCDIDGCQFHPYHLGSKGFYGPGGSVDTTKPFTVVTQFITDDGTDDGDLVEIQRYYIQGDKTTTNPKADLKTNPEIQGSSLTNGFCKAQKDAFDKHRNYKPRGDYLKAMGEAMDHGMVLIMSLWDDLETDMQWLDSSPKPHFHGHRQHSFNGPCFGRPEDVREEHPEALVKFSKFKYGDILSTCSTCTTTTTSTGTLSTSTQTSITTTTTTTTHKPPPVPVFRSPMVVAAVFAAVLTFVMVRVVLDSLRSQGWEFHCPDISARSPPMSPDPLSPDSSYH